MIPGIDVTGFISALFGKKKEGPMGPPTLQEQLASEAEKLKAKDFAQMSADIKHRTDEEYAKAAKQMSDMMSTTQQGLRRPARGRTGPRGNF